VIFPEALELLQVLVKMSTAVIFAAARYLAGCGGDFSQPLHCHDASVLSCAFFLLHF